jgi:hypothetical protein
VKTQLSDIKKRKVSAMSSRSASSTISGFPNAKVRGFEVDIEYTSHYRSALKKAYEAKTLSEADWNRMRKEIKPNETEGKKDYVTLKRQRKLIEDDIEETSIHKTMEHAYAKVMMNRVRIPREVHKSARNQKYTQETFRADLMRYYAVENKLKGKNFCYCVATERWWKSSEVKAAHIVPKSLESEELSFFVWRRRKGTVGAS